jgi:nickel-dependent lactate racemase
MASFFSQNRLEKAHREKIKIIVSFRSDPTRKRKFKKIAKKLNKLKDAVMASFQTKIGWKRPRKRKNENCLSVPFLPDM